MNGEQLCLKNIKVSQIFDKPQIHVYNISHQFVSNICLYNFMKHTYWLSPIFIFIIPRATLGLLGAFTNCIRVILRKSMRKDLFYFSNIQLIASKPVLPRSCQTSYRLTGLWSIYQNPIVNIFTQFVQLKKLLCVIPL